MAPVFRAIMKEFRSSFRQLSTPSRLILAERLLQSGIAEQANVAIHLLSLSVDDLLPFSLDYLDQVPNYFRSWGQTDYFSIDVMQPLLRKDRDTVLGLLEKWSHSQNRWKRRASMVVFARKIGASGEYTDDFLRLSESLIWDSDDFVRRGIGWALKDTMRGARDRITEYVKELRRKGVSSTIILYAIRDLRGRDREAILKIPQGQCGTL